MTLPIGCSIVSVALVTLSETSNTSQLPAGLGHPISWAVGVSGGVRLAVTVTVERPFLSHFFSSWATLELTDLALTKQRASRRGRRPHPNTDPIEPTRCARASPVLPLSAPRPQHVRPSCTPDKRPRFRTRTADIERPRPNEPGSSVLGSIRIRCSCSWSRSPCRPSGSWPCTWSGSPSRAGQS